MTQGGSWGPRLVLCTSDLEDCGSSMEGNLDLVRVEQCGCYSRDCEQGELNLRSRVAEMPSSYESPRTTSLAIELVAEPPGGFFGRGLNEDYGAGWSSDDIEDEGMGPTKVISAPSTIVGSSPATSGFFFYSPKKGSHCLFLESLNPTKGMPQNQWISNKMVHCGQIGGISVESCEGGWDNLVGKIGRIKTVIGLQIAGQKRKAPGSWKALETLLTMTNAGVRRS